MSVKWKREVTSLKYVESLIRRRTSFVFCGEELSNRNVKFWQDCLTLWAHLTYDLAPDPALVNARWINAVLDVPVDQLVSVLKCVEQHLLQEQSTDYASFKHWRTELVPQLGTILSPVVGLLRDLYKPEVTALKPLRTYLSFLGRANFPETIPALKMQAIDSWKSTATLPWDRVDVSRENSILKHMFPRNPRSNMTYQPYVPNHGPGTVADKPGIRDAVSKYKLMRFPRRAEYFLAQAGWRLDEIPRAVRGEFTENKLTFVPKNLDKYRTISQEPAALQFCQQGARDLIYSWLRATEWRHHVDLAHAELNQDLAWEGSISGQYATIDLHAASDYVKLDLVRALVRGTALEIPLLSLRSKTVNLDGESIVPSYYAPMGSDLCFLTETIVFCAIVQAVVGTGRKHVWRVYGDDIVVETEYAEAVCNRLTQLGFIVNTDKTFTDPRRGFRESCGGDYFYGEDVYPLRLSRRFRGLDVSHRTPKAIPGLVDMANRAYHYPHLRSRVLEALRARLPRQRGVLFEDTGEVGVFSTEPSNFHLEERWNPDLQRTEYKHGALVVKTKTTAQACLDGDGDILLYEWLRRAEARGPDVPLDAEPPDYCEVLSIKWVSTWGSPAPGWSARASE